LRGRIPGHTYQSCDQTQKRQRRFEEIFHAFLKHYQADKEATGLFAISNPNTRCGTRNIATLERSSRPAIVVLHRRRIRARMVLPYTVRTWTAHRANSMYRQQLRGRHCGYRRCRTPLPVPRTSRMRFPSSSTGTFRLTAARATTSRSTRTF